MDKRFWAIILVIVVIFGGVLFFSNMHKANAPTAKPTSHTEGKGTKNVTLVEYGDYECPACEEYYPVVKQIFQKYGNDITIQFRNLPLTQLHPNAFAGARAAEAAALQNKFWEMHDALYDHQTDWAQSQNPQQFFNQYAQQLSLNLDQFKKDYASSAVNDTINADVAEFNKTKADLATPSFFLDGKQIKPNPSIDDFSKLIDAEIAKKNPTPTATTNTPASAQD